jgi:hypothetical protein
MTKQDKLNKKYKKVLDKCHCSCLSHLNMEAGLDYFLTYLAYVRDSLVLTVKANEADSGESNEHSPRSMALAAAVCALNEYELYKTCYSNYYDGAPPRLFHKIGFTAEEAATQYAIEKQTHWDAFWHLIKMNIESWSSYV